MTTWTDTNTIETGWVGEDGITEPILTYGNGLTYSVDYVTYDGRYIKDNIDWTAQQQLETAWRDGT